MRIRKFNEEINDNPVIEKSEGFYWVKLGDKWVPGEWENYDDGSGGCWSIVASDEIFKDEDFEEIGHMIPDNVLGFVDPPKG